MLGMCPDQRHVGTRGLSAKQFALGNVVLESPNFLLKFLSPLEPAKSSVAKQQRRQISVIMAFEPQKPLRAMPCLAFRSFSRATSFMIWLVGADDVLSPVDPGQVKPSLSILY